MKKPSPKKKQESYQGAILDDVPIKYPELFIGLVGPLGIDLDLIFQQLRKAFKYVGYDTQVIKLSAALEEIKGLPVKIYSSPEDKRIESLIKAGNTLREKVNSADALAILSMGQIREYRKKKKGDYTIPSERTAYILRSIKTKKEVETLRATYGENFFLISTYSHQENRKENLAKKIAHSHHRETDVQSYYSAAEKLIQTDSGEENDFGQGVIDAFPLADLFVQTDNKKELQHSIERFINTIFGYPFTTPTKDEFGMFQAFGVALRSSDLSRQVGAAILDDEGDIITLGCNEVPKFGGGIYWGNNVEQIDGRDHAFTGYDSSARMKEQLLAELIDRLKKTKFIIKKGSPRELADELLYGRKKKALQGTLVSNLLEHGRIIHAEMAAITDASKRGLSLSKATLYCTTFPCHICARHIIAAGVKRVVYVEPYPKSLAADLYKDSIRKDPSASPDNHLVFEPFVGISPRRYKDLLSALKRKEPNGDAKSWSGSEGKPRIKVIYPAYIHAEQKIIALLTDRMVRSKIHFS